MTVPDPSAAEKAPVAPPGRGVLAFYGVLADLASRRMLLGRSTRARRVADAADRLGASGLFDADDYRRRYPDVAASGVSPAEHFLTRGHRLGYIGRPPQPKESNGEQPSGYDAVDLTPLDEGAIEPTHLGRVMDEATARARLRMRPVGEDADYDAVRSRFDVAGYLLQTPELLAPGAPDPVRHFMGSNAQKAATPDIDFSPQAAAASQAGRPGTAGSAYLEWLRGTGDPADADPAPGIEQIATILDLPPEQVVAELSAWRGSLQERLRTGRLGEMFAKAAEIEPLVAAAWPATTRPKLPPVPANYVIGSVSAIHACQEALGYKRARLVLVINRPRWGGGRRLEGHLTHALAAHLDPSEIAVIYTDDSGTTPPDRYPAGVREVDLTTVVRGLHPEIGKRVLIELIRSLNPEAVVNINSSFFYRAMRAYGRALAASTHIFICFFNNEQQPQGNWVGYPLRHFYRLADLVTGFITDSAALRESLIESYQLSEAQQRRMHVFSAPADGRLPLVEPAPRTSGRRPQLFWAGRWDRQKRIDLVAEIARRMPDVDIRMWGEAVLEGGRGTVAGLPENMVIEGRYGHVTELPFADADAWLYTSGWDGVPSILLEVAMTGVPIVGSLVGGTGEVLDPKGSWPVDPADDPQAYVDALREVLADPDGARAKARTLRERLVRERTLEAYGEVAARVLLPGGEG